MMLLRKKQKLSQSALGKVIGTSGDVIGRYERGDIKPSIDVVSKIAEALDVSIDYLIGKTTFQLDGEALKRFKDIAELPKENQAFLYNMIDMALRDAKTRQAYGA
jgi:transcriptional regulator with XRE-family HTH domain